MDDPALTRASDKHRLAPGTRVLHIGPHKTGTTAIQAALFEAHDTLAERGIYYPGFDRHPMHAVLAATNRPSMMGDAAPKDRHWRRLVDEVIAAGDQMAVVSSEFFADASPDAIARIVDDLGAERVHVVVTLRPLVKILPSQWQQYVQNGLRQDYEGWLRNMLEKAPYEQPTPSFWRRHRHDKLIARWVDVVGPQNLTVIVVDDSDPGFLLRVFESLLGLPDGLLAPIPDATNRSLTLGEIEMVRRFNVEFRSHDLPESLYSRLLRYGAVPQLKVARSPAADEPRVTTPDWATKRAVEIGGEIADWVRQAGVRVIGDLDLLHQLPDVAESSDSSVADETSEPTLDPAAAAQALYGAIAAAQVTLGGAIDPQSAPPSSIAVPEQPAPLPRVTDLPVKKVRSSQLVKVLVRRMTRRVRRLLHR